MEENNMKISKETGAKLIFASVAVGLLAIWSAYRGRELMRTKNSARREIRRTNVDLYDKEDRKNIQKAVKRSTRKIEKAKTRTAVYSAQDAFDDSMDAFRTSPVKLADEKMDAAAEAYEFLMTRKDGGRTDGSAEYVKAYTDRVRGAVNRDQIKKLRKEFQTRTRGR